MDRESSGLSETIGQFQRRTVLGLLGGGLAGCLGDGATSPTPPPATSTGGSETVQTGMFPPVDHCFGRPGRPEGAKRPADSKRLQESLPGH